MATLAALVVLAGCGSGDRAAQPAPSVPATIAVRAGFADGATIPTRYTCDGAGAAPPLSWHRVPAAARALAVVVDDPDAPGGTFTHWIVVDLPASARELAADRVPAGAHQATNSGGDAGWTPPCPPSGDRSHHYRFTVYALRARTGLPDGADQAKARSAIDRLAVASGRTTGRYARAS